MKFNPRLIPPNVDFIPKPDSKVKSLVLEIADIAINPAVHDFNNQAQMIEYCARGVPIISTPVGIEEFNFQDNKYCLVGETWQFPELLSIAQQENIEDKETRIQQARKYISKEFKWNNIFQKILNSYSMNI